MHDSKDIDLQLETILPFSFLNMETTLAFFHKDGKVTESIKRSIKIVIGSIKLSAQFFRIKLPIPSGPQAFPMSSCSKKVKRSECY